MAIAPTAIYLQYRGTETTLGPKYSDKAVKREINSPPTSTFNLANESSDPKALSSPPQVPWDRGEREREREREDQKLIIREKCENGEGPGGGCFRTTSATAQNSPLVGTGGPERWKDSPWLFSKRGKRTVKVLSLP